MGERDSRASGRGGLAGVLLLLGVLVLESVRGGGEAAPEARQYRLVELAFQAERERADPFDPAREALRVRWTHAASGRCVDLRGFWDGERTWRVRFQPELAGRWGWVSHSDDATDRGLHGREGAVEVTAAPGEGAPAQHRHGGILRVAGESTHLTHADGTPFFWLGDTWWGMPSSAATPEHLRKLIAARQAQGFTVAQIHGHRNLDSAEGPDVFQLMEPGAAAAPALGYWRKLDGYYGIAEEAGWQLCTGFYGYWSERKYSLETHHRLWGYFLARYGSYPVSFLITQEYNQPYETRQADGTAVYDASRTHGPFFRELGRWIAGRDPYGRAMTAHSAVRSRDRLDAWPDPWYGFALLQNGHFSRPDPAYYRSICTREPVKPVIEGETNYEAFVRPKPPAFAVDATVVRTSAYGAIQSGCAGFSYGAQGLYGHIVNPAFPGPSARWGPVLTWEQALGLEGASHLAHLSRLYRSLPWWRLRHLPKAVDGADAVLAKADGDELCLLYFLPAKEGAAVRSRLCGFSRQGVALEARWQDPRSGLESVAAAPEWEGEALRLPARPDGRDWLLLLRARGP